MNDNIKEQADNAADKAANKAKDFANRAANKTDDIRREVNSTADKAADKAKQLTSRAVNKADDALASLHDRFAEFKASATIDEYVDRMRECIREKPFKSVAIAFAAGCIWHGMRSMRRK